MKNWIPLTQKNVRKKAFAFFVIALSLGILLSVINNLPETQKTQNRFKTEPSLVLINKDLLISSAYAANEPVPKQENDPNVKNAPPNLNKPSKYRYEPDENRIEVEFVLVPQKITIISSSRDGRIEDIPLYPGDMFSKGDTLLSYACHDIEAEAEIAAYDKALADKKAQGGFKLFKLDLISEVEQMAFKTEIDQAIARQKLYAARLENCLIRADFDGRVTNRLANPGEYTRTDRVLLEVASTGVMHAEFLMPSKWLRFVNVGAPLEVTVNETGDTFNAEVIRIYGEVDPVSQSIQVTAKLNTKSSILLPGMSGQAVLDIDNIRAAGVRGFLDQTIASLE